MADELSDPRLTAFLAALKNRAHAQAATLPDLTPVRQIEAGADLPGLFVEHATRSGMDVRTCRGTELVYTLIEQLRTAEVDSVILSVENASPLSATWDAMRAALATADIRTLQPGDEAWFSAGAGVTTVHGAVAETGSLLIASGANTPRSASLIPPVHIALVGASQIMPDLVDAFAALDRREMPAGVVLITGPSKTADIEGVLVTGVHGPGRVLIILVTDA